MAFLPFLLFILPCYSGASTDSYEIGDCGIQYGLYKPYIANAIDTKYNEYPWHVALYKMGNTSSYEYACGGSIIDANIVITAAHCVFDEEKENLDYSRMVVVTGKYHSAWEIRDKYEQHFEVISKKVPPGYRGMDNRYQEDIALLALNDSIKFSSLVIPICVDWTSSYEPNEEAWATFVGWGYNEARILSEKLMMASMQQRNFDECRKSVAKGFTFFLTSDKFCAICDIKETDLRQGDSGGGLMFMSNLGTEEKPKYRYYIKGILSGKQQSNGYFFFTNVSNHISWINSTKINIINEINLRKVCGIRTQINITEPGGYVSSYTDYPWIATIYMRKHNKFFGIRCVGTIIHQRAILTSYWCINDDRPHYKEIEYRVYVGKHELNVIEVKEGEQDLSIFKKHKHENYVDWKSRAENELVILIVDQEIKFTKTVAPICIDWGRTIPMTDPVGMIASWDIDECHCQVMAKYRYYNITDCAQAFEDSEEHQRYVTSEKICGKYINGTDFKYGSDIGAGYFFLKNGTTKHYLQGIVSKGRPTEKDFLIFTSVEMNLRWIGDILLTIYNTVS